MSKNIYISLGVAIVLIVAIWGLYFFNNKAPKVNLDNFAKCLASKDVTMYGAEWCAHCKAEKARFGSSFQYVNYVECPDNVKLCTDKKIENFPSWIIGEKIYEGEQGLENLSKLSGCELPSAK